MCINSDTIADAYINQLKQVILYNYKNSNTTSPVFSIASLTSTHMRCTVCCSSTFAVRCRGRYRCRECTPRIPFVPAFDSEGSSGQRTASKRIYSAVVHMQHAFTPLTIHHNSSQTAHYWLFQYIIIKLELDCYACVT